MPDHRDALFAQLIVDSVGVTDDESVSLVREHYGLAVRVVRLTVLGQRVASLWPQSSAPSH